MIEPLSKSMAAIEDAGFTGIHAYPEGLMANLTQVVAAVEVESLDQAADTVTVRVTVISPISIGAEECENAALEIARALYQQGASCTMKRCEFLSSANLFQSAIFALYSGAL